MYSDEEVAILQYRENSRVDCNTRVRATFVKDGGGANFYCS